MTGDDVEDELDEDVQQIANKKARARSKTIAQGMGDAAQKARYRRFSAERVC